MRYCKNCNIEFLQNIDKCILCSNDLLDVNNENTNNSYPYVNLNFHKYNNIIRIFLLMSIIGSIICLTVNYITTPTVPWSFICIACIAYLWICVPIFIKNNINTTSKIIGQTVLAIIVSVALDFIIEYNGWSLNFAIPTIIVISHLCMFLLLYINNKPYDNYFSFYLLLAIISFVPITLYLTKLSSVFWPTLWSTIFSVIMILFLSIFYSDKIKIELQKRFHF